MVYTPVLNEKCGFEADITVTRIARDGYFIIMAAGEKFNLRLVARDPIYFPNKTEKKLAILNLIFKNTCNFKGEV